MKTLKSIFATSLLFFFLIVGLGRANCQKIYKYKHSLEALHKKFGQETETNAEAQWDSLMQINNTGFYKATLESLNSHICPEWFRDAKLGMFFDWGPWSVAGYDEKGWTRARYPDTYLGFMYGRLRKYHESTWGADFHRDDFIPLFSGKTFDADSLIGLATRSGMKYIVPFSKHMDGYCQWNSSFTFRNSVDMPPFRDFAKEITDAARKRGIKTGAYFCLEEFQHPLVDKSGNIVMSGQEAGNVPGFGTDPQNGVFRPFIPSTDNRMASGMVPVSNYSRHYLVPLIKEYIDLYDPDILWYDAEWTRNIEKFKTPELSAYFYNQAEGRKEVVVNDRYGIDSRQIWGDFNTSEFDEGEKTLGKPWEECRPVGESYGYYMYDNDSTVLSARELIYLFVRIVSKNGNLLLMVCPDANGNIPDYQQNRLLELGDWLKINGEAIYSTRPYYTSCDDLNTGQNVWYTQSKDGKYGYAIFFEWPKSETILLRNARPVWEKNIYLLGYDTPLRPNIDWVDTGSKLWGLTVKLPEEWYNEQVRKGKYAWVIKFETR